MTFLKAEWRKLILANYEVDPALLKKYLPYKTELDYWKDSCYVSLVGFMFHNTRMLGVPIPLHRNFEEVNLRFYVKYNDNGNWKRGVVFIKELVPKRAITFVANTIYMEHYETVKMSHLWKTEGKNRLVEYAWWNNGIKNSMQVKADIEPIELVPGSEEEFITEHYWGYTKLKANKTSEYQVTHPKWKCYSVDAYNIEVDFGETYGSDFGELNRTKPKSVMLAEGSEISVEGKSKIT